MIAAHYLSPRNGPCIPVSIQLLSPSLWSKQWGRALTVATSGSCGNEQKTLGSSVHQLTHVHFGTSLLLEFTTTLGVFHYRGREMALAVQTKGQ